MVVNQYEEARRKMVEENKKRMEELGLFDLVEGFNLPSSKKPMKKWVKQEPGGPSRRSVRAAAKPAVDYKLSIPAERYIGASAADIAVLEAVEKASTEITNPTFVRHVLYSYGAGSYHGYIPFEFRRNYMPESDKWFILEDEDGTEWSILFNAEHGELRKGWRDFSTHHHLMAGDICLFELVSPLRFRVQTFRYAGSQKKLGSNVKKVAGEGSQMEKMSSTRKRLVAEDGLVQVGKKPKLEVDTLDNYQIANRQEAQLSLRMDRKPKIEAKQSLEGNLIGACGEERLSFLVDMKPKLEPQET